MLIKLAALACLAVGLCQGQRNGSKTPWKGYAVLGNGRLTAVYSDDSRITAITHASGIQHLYFGDYTADYLASTSFRPMGEPAATASETGMQNFYTTRTRTSYSNGSTQTVLCFAHPNDAVVLSVSPSLAYRFEAVLRKGFTSLQADKTIALATWPTGTVLAIAPKSKHATVSLSGSSIVVTGPLQEVVILPARSRGEAVSKIQTLLRSDHLEADAKDHWETWMNAGQLPAPKGEDAQQYLEAYKRNLYCVKAANLNGQIPADITGQFVTNDMPQLYPRDAMMCARVFLLTGHPEEARQVIEFWANRRIPMKTPGEWYARYDAHGQPVDAGSGARFDEPEWDANGYFIYLVNAYHRATGVWLSDPKFLYQLADFLVAHIDSNGLLEEGGIVEWTGYLPATNMICAAALRTAAKIAHDLSNDEKSAAYNNVAQRISDALPQMFDRTRQTYADVRFTDRKGPHGESLTGHAGEKTYLWDTSANAGVVWGYPDHRDMQLSNAFYAANTVKLGGGMQYFDSPDPGLAAYGHGCFFFTTAIAAEYQSLYGDNVVAKRLIDWMLRNANSYGLMPERILPDGSDCSPATPLSWCSAEFAAALLLWSGR